MVWCFFQQCVLVIDYRLTCVCSLLIPYDKIINCILWLWLCIFSWVRRICEIRVSLKDITGYSLLQLCHSFSNSISVERKFDWFARQGIIYYNNFLGHVSVLCTVWSWQNQGTQLVKIGEKEHGPTDVIYEAWIYSKENALLQESQAIPTGMSLIKGHFPFLSHCLVFRSHGCWTSRVHK